MTAHTGIAILFQQLVHQSAQSGALGRAACVGRMTVTVQAAFIANAYGMSVPAFHMRSRQLYGAGEDDSSIPAYVVMIACALESAVAVASVQCFGSKRTALPGGTAMHHNQMNSSFHKIDVFREIPPDGRAAVRGNYR